MRRRLLHLKIVLLAFCFLGTLFVHAAEPLVWHQKKETFDADISKAQLPDLLRDISSLTGWQVYLEPGVSFESSAKFKDLPRADALRLLLGTLNFELSSKSNSVPTLFVFRTGAGNATQLIRTDKKGAAKIAKDGRITSQLIVTLKPGSKINIDVLAQQLGAKVAGKIDGQNAYLLEFSDEASADAARQQLSQTSDVASVDSNYSMEKPAPFSMASVNGSSPFNLKANAGGGDGNTVVVGLIDTAVQQLGAEMEKFLLPPLSTADEARVDGVQPTHGTTMAESILFGANTMLQSGQGSSLKILPVDIYGNDENTTTFRVASGVTMAVNNGANIVSLSLGSEGNSPFLEQLLQQVRDKGILVFAAAGNQPVTTPTYPAAYPSVIAVTSAQNSRGEVAPYANRGPFVDVILPGATVVPFNGGNWYVNGTSVSTALASGMMAGLAERSRRAPTELEQTFRETVRFQPPKP